MIPDIMTFEEWLKVSIRKLELVSVATARLDALVLLEDVIGQERSLLLAHPEKIIEAGALKKLEAQLRRRLKHEPLAYIRGKTEFYGREFLINKHVLEPRPESETMIELLKQLIYSKQLPADSLKIADIGTGSGALAITAKLEISRAEVIATDIDESCLKIAMINANKFKLDIKFLKGDLIQPLSAVNCKPSAILANLPYVPDDFRLNEAAKNEPKLAIFGGPDGLDIYRRLFEQTIDLKIKPKFILTESLPTQHRKLARIARNASYKLAKTDDFIQLFELN